QIMQPRPPLLVFFEVFSDMSGEQDVARIAATHHPVRQIQTGASEVRLTSYIYNPADRPTMDAHPNTQTRMIFESAAQLHGAPNRRFGTCVKDQCHAVARGNFD